MTPLGYLAAIAIEAVVCVSMTLMGTPSLCILVGTCALLSLLTKDITNDLVNFNADIVATKRLSNTLIKSRFSIILHEFADAKQLSKKLINRIH